MTQAIAARAALRAARRLTSSVAAVAVAALVAVAPAAAHGEQLLQLGAERIQPGGAIEVRGDLGAGEAFEVALIGKADGSRRLIGTIPAIEEGHFQAFVTVPADVPTGDDLLEVAVDASVIRAPLTIAGSPIVDGGEGPDQGAPLVQPLPSGPGAATGAGAGNAAATGAGAGNGAASPAAGDPSPASSRADRSPLDGAIVIGLAATVAIGVLFALRLLGRGRRTPERGGPARP